MKINTINTHRMRCIKHLIYLFVVAVLMFGIGFTIDYTNADSRTLTVKFSNNLNSTTFVKTATWDNNAVLNDENMPCYPVVQNVEKLAPIIASYSLKSVEYIGGTDFSSGYTHLDDYGHDASTVVCLNYSTTAEVRFIYEEAPHIIVSNNVNGVIEKAYGPKLDTINGSTYVDLDMNSINNPLTITGYTFIRTDISANIIPYDSDVYRLTGATGTIHHIYSRQLPPTPTKEGHTFTGWYLDEACTQKYVDQIIAGDTQLYAGWLINAYNITFVKNNGEANQTVTQNYNTFVNPLDVVKTGHTFGSWYSNPTLTALYDFGTPLKNNVTLYAQWTINTYTYSYVTNCDIDNFTDTAVYNTAINYPNINRSGYKLVGWYLDETCNIPYDFNSMVVKNKTLYASWELIKYNVTFKFNNGADDKNEIYVYTQKATAPYVEREGYNFKGWYLDANCTIEYDFNSYVSCDMVLYASWDIIKYEVTFIVDGNIFHLMKVPYGSVIGQTKDGKALIRATSGLYVDKERTTLLSGAVKNDLTLYGTMTKSMRNWINFGYVLMTYWWAFLIGIIVLAVGVFLTIYFVKRG